jgi:hypothetical protein
MAEPAPAEPTDSPAPTAPSAVVIPVTAAPPVGPNAELVDWGSFLEKVGKHVLLASIAIYAIGYVIAINCYTSAGVPSADLSHNTFIGAGVLFLVLCGLAAATLMTARLDLRNRKSPKSSLKTKIVVFLSSYAVASQVAWIPLAGGNLAFLVFHIYFLASVGVIAALDFLRSNSNLERHRTLWTFGMLSLFLVTMFAIFIYPLGQPAYGGGRPMLLYVWNRAGKVPVAVPAEIRDLRCEPNAEQPPGCRIVSLVYSSGSHLYFSIEERAAECPDPANVEPMPIGTLWIRPRGRPPSLRPANTRICFARIADANIKTLPFGPFQ